MKDKSKQSKKQAGQKGGHDQGDPMNAIKITFCKGGTMNKIPLALLVLGLAMLACSLSPEMPTAGNAAEIFPTPTITPTGTASTTPAPTNCTITAEALHLRDAPNIEGKVIAFLSHGDQLTILTDPPAVGVWVNVVTADKLTGWINGGFCERKSQ